MNKTIQIFAIAGLLSVLISSVATAYINEQQAGIATHTILNVPYFYVDNNTSNMDSNPEKGTHSNFTSQQYGPDSIYDMLIEENTGGKVALEDYIDNNTSDVDSSTDLGSHSNFESQKAKDSIYDALTEENTGGTGTDVEDYVDAASDIDSSPDIGTHSNFENQKAKDTTYNTITEASTPVGGNWGLDRSDGTGTAVADYRYMGSTSPNLANMNITKLHYYASVAGQIAIGVWEGGTLNDPVGAMKILQALNVTVAVGWNEIDVSNTSWSANTITWIGWTNGGTGSQSAYVTTGDFGDFASVAGRYSQTTPAAANVTQDMNDTITTGSFSAYWYCMYIEYSTPDSYQLDLEVQFTGVNYDEINEYLCIYVGNTDAEDIKVDYWTGSAWSNLITDLSPNVWNNVSVSLTSTTFTIRFKDGTLYGDVTSNQWQIDATLVHVWDNPQNWELDLEIQFTDFIDFLSTEKLCIYAGALGNEDLKVDYWNGTDWENLATDITINSWNNYTVSLTSSTFTIRFKDGTNVGDTATQDQWQIDVSLLRVEGAGSIEDAVDNDTSDVDESDDIGSLNDFDNMKTYDSNYANLTETASGGEITYVNYAQNSNNDGGSVTVNKPSGTIDDDFMFAIVISARGSDADGSTISSAPPGWTEEHNYINTAASGQQVYIYWKIASSEGASYTWTWTDSDCSSVGQIMTYRGVDTSSPIHKEGTVNQESSIDPMMPSITPTEDGCVILIYGMCDDDDADVDGSGEPSGYTWIDTIECTGDYGAGLSTAYLIQETAAATGNQDWTFDATEENSGQQYAFLPASAIGDYQLDQEVQWTNVNYFLPNEELCIYVGTTDEEDMLVDVWNGTDWENLATDLIAGQWNNITITSYLDSNNFTIRYRDGTPSGDSLTQDTWLIDVTLIHVWNEEESYKLDLEVQWTNVDYSEANEELCIYLSDYTQGSLDALGGYMIVGDGSPDWGSASGTISFWVKIRLGRNRLYDELYLFFC